MGFAEIIMEGIFLLMQKNFFMQKADEKNYYIIVVNKFGYGKDFLPAEFIFNTLISKSIWEFNKRTGNLSKLQKNDKVAFYQAGKGGQKFIARAEFASAPFPKTEQHENYFKEDFMSYFNWRVNLKNIVIFDQPVFIRDILENLKFAVQKKYYGHYFRQAILKINKEDYDLICSI